MTTAASGALRLVQLESPYAGSVAANVAYARACLADCLRRGEAPFASHLLYTQPGVLDDGNPAERALGIEAGLAWLRVVDAVVVYVDRGVSRGMEQGIARAAARGLLVEYRSIAETTAASGDGAPFRVGDLVRTDFYPQYANVVRRVVDVQPSPHASQTGWYVTADGPGGGLCVDAGWFTAATEGE